MKRRRMIRLRRPWERPALLLAALGLASCATPPRPAAPAPPIPAPHDGAVEAAPAAVDPAKAAEAAKAFAEAMDTLRAEGRRQTESILAVLAQVSAEDLPGIAAFRADVARAFDGRRGTEREYLNAEEVRRLTLGNPHYWQAWFEFSPADASAWMLRTSLLMEAGDLFPASMLLTTGVQALPVSLGERGVWLTQQARVHWALFRRLESLKARPAGGRPDRAAVEATLAEWPEDGFTAEVLLRLRADLPAERPGGGGETITLPATVRTALAADLERLRRHSPLTFVRYGEPAASAASFSRLWQEFLDDERPVDDRAVLRMANDALRIGLPDVALMLSRVAAARRGYFAPADLALVQPALEAMLTEEERAGVLELVGSGRIGLVQFTRPAEAPRDVLAGMDPRVHPLLAEHGLREIARESLWIESTRETPELQAQHLRLRSVRNSNIGRAEAALRDIEAALAIRPAEIGWQVDRAVVLEKLGRGAEADEVFAAIEAASPGDERVRSSRAIQQFGRGNFAEAERLFKAAPADDPNRAYAVIFAYHAGARHGAADREFLARQAGVAAGKWPEAILRFLAQQIDRRALLDAARDASDFRRTEQLCEAYFTLGEVALAAGDTKTAAVEFENCLTTGVVGFVEFDLAKRELERLQPAAPAPASVAEPVVTPASPPVPAKGAGSVDGGPA